MRQVVHGEETGLSETEVELQAANYRPPRGEPVWSYPLIIMYVSWKLDYSRVDAKGGCM